MAAGAGPAKQALDTLSTFDKIRKYVQETFGAPERTRMLGRLVENQGLDNWMTYELMDAAVLKVVENFGEVENVSEHMTRDQATSTTADANHLNLKDKAVNNFFNFQSIRVDQDAKAYIRHQNRPDGMFHLKLDGQDMVLFYEGDAHEKDAGKSVGTVAVPGKGCMNSHKMYQYIAQSQSKTMDASACAVFAAMVHVPTDDFVVFLDDMLKAHIFVCIAIAQHNGRKTGKNTAKTALDSHMGLKAADMYDFVVGINIQSTDDPQEFKEGDWQIRVDAMLARLNLGGGVQVTINLRDTLRQCKGGVNFRNYNFGCLAVTFCAIRRPAENLLDGVMGVAVKFNSPFVYPMHLTKLVPFAGKTASLALPTHLLTIQNTPGPLRFRKNMMDVTRVYGNAGMPLSGHLCNLDATTGFFYCALPLAYYTIQQFDCLVNARLNYRWKDKPNNFKKMLDIYKQQMKSIVTKYVKVKMFSKKNTSLLQTICRSTDNDTDPISKDFAVFLQECCRWEAADVDAYAHPAIFFRTLGVFTLQSAIDFACETQHSQNKTYTALLSSYPIGTQIAIQQCMKKLAGNAAYAYLNRADAAISTRTEEEQGDSADDEDEGMSVIRMIKGGSLKLKRKVTNSVWAVSIDSIASVTVVGAGAAYTVRPAITIAAPAASAGNAADGRDREVAEASATVRAGTVHTIKIDAPGSGYIGAMPVVTIGAVNGATIASAVALPGRMGSLQSVEIRMGGKEYTAIPTVKFVGGVGQGAVATAVVINQTVARILLTDAGSGYTSAPTVTFEGNDGEGDGAVAIAHVIETTDLGDELAAIFQSSFKDWTVSQNVMSFILPINDNVRKTLEDKFVMNDAAGNTDVAGTKLLFEAGIAMDQYPKAYQIIIDGTAWYFKPEYPKRIEHANDDDDVTQNIGDCVYAKFGQSEATVYFKLVQRHAILGVLGAVGGAVSGVVARAGRAVMKALGFSGEYDEELEDQTEPLDDP